MAKETKEKKESTKKASSTKKNSEAISEEKSEKTKAKGVENKKESKDKAVVAKQVSKDKGKEKATDKSSEKSASSKVSKKGGITYYQITATCACGAKYETGSTKESIRVDICAGCHPFFTGEQKILDTEGRVDKFKKKYNLS